jgi:hypothetical protein
MVPAFAPAADDAGTRRAAVALATWVVREAALVLVVFACTALLGQLPPPRHDAGTHAPDHAVHGTRPDHHSCILTAYPPQRKVPTPFAAARSSPGAFDIDNRFQ